MDIALVTVLALGVLGLWVLAILAVCRLAGLNHRAERRCEAAPQHDASPVRHHWSSAGRKSATSAS